MPTHIDVAIVGGGVTGLSTAWYLQQAAQSQRVPISYTLLEQGNRWGGKILTETQAGYGDDFVVEGGPDSFITQKPWALQLAHELELAGRLLPTNDHLRQVFVLNKGRPTPLPDGVLLIVPTRLVPFALSPLISPLGKLRMGLDLFIPPRRDGQDETLAAFIERRLGVEALDKIAEPLMSGIYNAEAERQSLLATFPRFRALEEQHGSLIKGMLASRARANGDSAGQPPPEKRPALSMFVSFQDGMQELISALRTRLTGDCRLSTMVQDIQAAPDGRYTLSLSDGRCLVATAIVLAVPAFVAAALVAGLAPEATAQLQRIRYVSTGVISLAFRKDEFDHPLNGFGLVIPRSEKRSINAITWTSTKFNHRAPFGCALLRVFFGGSRSPHMMDVSDEVLVAVVRSELKALMSITAGPLFHRIYRWHRANPQYDVGHLDLVASIETALPANIYVTGSPYRGIGVPDCVNQARQTAEKVVRQMIDPQRVAVAQQVNCSSM